MRSFALLLAFLLASQGGAQAQGLPPMPEPEIPAYLPPLEFLSELPPGEIRVEGEAVIFDRPAHLRLKLSLSIAERLSSDRARAAWRSGWLSGVDAMLPRVQDERRARLAAEAEAEGREVPLGKALSRASWIVAGALVLGAGFGLWLGSAK